MILGISCFGLITATVTTFFLQRSAGARQYTTNDIMTVLQDVQSKLARLEEEVVADAPSSIVRRHSVSSRPHVK